MLCNRFFDFVSGTEIALAAPPCRSSAAAGSQDAGAYLDIVRPNDEARALVEAHMSALTRARTKPGPAR